MNKKCVVLPMYLKVYRISDAEFLDGEHDADHYVTLSAPYQYL